MSALDMLDVAIGVIFLYLVMSLVASAAVEFLEALLQYRARDLEHGVRELLEDPSLVKKLYDHPLVRSLYMGNYVVPGKTRFLGNWHWSKWRLPSYIPA